MTAKVVRLNEIHTASRVAVIGAVIHKDDDRITIDDGTGPVDVMLSQDVPYEVKDVVRVIGRAYGSTIEAEIVQDANGTNTDLYKRALGIIQTYHEY